MEQFEFKRISPFKWGKTGRVIIVIVISVYLDDLLYELRQVNDAI